VRAWDPIADGNGLHGVVISATPEEAATGADAVVVVTEWPQLKDVDWGAVAKTMRTPVLIDGRNLLDPVELRAAGFTFEGIGRAAEIA
jgi:UDPglucose 6-dehydrogenase